jgi:hypothetical protein
MKRLEHCSSFEDFVYLHEDKINKDPLSSHLQKYAKNPKDALIYFYSQNLYEMKMCISTIIIKTLQICETSEIPKNVKQINDFVVQTIKELKMSVDLVNLVGFKLVVDVKDSNSLPINFRVRDSKDGHGNFEKIFVFEKDFTETTFRQVPLIRSPRLPSFETSPMDPCG